MKAKYQSSDVVCYALCKDAVESRVGLNSKKSAVMQNKRNYLNRRAFVKLAGIVVTGCTFVNICEGEGDSRVVASLFDGKTLDGWIQNKLLLEDAYPEDLMQTAPTSWIVKDGVMASTGSGRGVIYTAKDYSRYRLMFTMRHVSGSPDHQACVLIFCTRPGAEEK